MHLLKFDNYFFENKIIIRVVVRSKQKPVPCPPPPPNYDPTLF